MYGENWRNDGSEDNIALRLGANLDITMCNDPGGIEFRGGAGPLDANNANELLDTMAAIAHTVRTQNKTSQTKSHENSEASPKIIHKRILNAFRKQISNAPYWISQKISQSNPGENSQNKSEQLP